MSTIRLAHITDTHLGYRALGKQDPATGRNQRTVDFEQALERCIDDILQQEVDGVLHAGDVFDQTRPTWQTLRHFIQQFRRLEDAGIPTLVIAGNHDTPRLRTGGSAYSVLELALPRIRFVAEYTDVHVDDLFAHLDLHVHAVPHGALTNDDPVIPMPDARRRSILMTHGMVPGMIEHDRTGEHAEQILNTTLLVPEFDYIALGHYHLFTQPPGIANGWYAGSTERNGWGDYGATPGYCIVELDDLGSPPRVQHIDIPGRRMVDIGRVNGESMAGRDIADAVLTLLEAVSDTTAMARVAILNAERADKREAESILKREAGHYVWDLQSMAERPLFAASARNETELTDDIPNVRELFHRFVDARQEAGYYSGTFRKAFEATGDAALERAIADADQIAPEGDVLA